jgi:hypothetical protein
LQRECEDDLLPAACYCILLIAVRVVQADAVESVACDFVPEAEKASCVYKAHAAVKHAVRLFEDYVSPASICKPLCGAEAEMISAQTKAIVSDIMSTYPQCPFCEYLTEAPLESNQDVSALHASCAALPEAFAVACQEFVQQNGVRPFNFWGQSVTRGKGRGTANAVVVA